VSTRFQPEEILRVLEGHAVRYLIIGGVAATLHGSPLITRDTDICPSRDAENLTRLADALRALGARIRTLDAPEGLPFACDAAFLQRMQVLNLTTRFGDLDISFEPSGTGGYDDLRQRAVRSDLGKGLVVPLASLEDVIRSKEAANRDKDRAALPTLRLLLEKIKERDKPSS
jgi:hypothetical protein